MGKCIYCGMPAGLFRKKHAECEKKHNALLLKHNRSSGIITKAIYDHIIQYKVDYDSLKNFINTEVFRSNLPDENLKYCYIGAFEKAVEDFLSDNILTKQEEKSLLDFTNYFNLLQTELDINGAYSRIVKSGILRDIFEGKLPQRVTINGTLSFNLQKNEKIIWYFPQVDYYEQKTRRQIVGRSHGVSVRIMKGVYYRIGEFKGYPVETQETINIGTGDFAITNKHLYFSCSVKSFRIAHSKIVNITAHSDGVTIQRDASSAKPQSFVTGDGWFTYNLLQNVQNV